MREIVFDTETTGFDPNDGDRVVEIGCVELLNGMPTGENYHVYINPNRTMPDSAFKIHGLSTEFLSDKPMFNEIANGFLDFIKEDNLVAHNAEFDMKFINWELENSGLKPLTYARVVDTLKIAREKFPGAKNSLDALCSRFGIDNSNRTLHGALLDSEILAEVYLELKGGRQAGMDLSVTSQNVASDAPKKIREKRSFPPTSEELKAHKKFLEKITDPLWSRASSQE